MTIKKCARHCKGFKYMGVQVSNIVQCNEMAITSVSNNNKHLKKLIDL